MLENLSNDVILVVLSLGDLSPETKALLFKIIIPTLVTISVKLALQHQKQKVTIFQAFVSLAAGMWAAYIFGDYVMSTFDHKWQPLIIAVVAMSGEKIGYYIMYKVNANSIIEFLLKIKK